MYNNIGLNIVKLFLDKYSKDYIHNFITKHYSIAVFEKLFWDLLHIMK